MKKFYAFALALGLTASVSAQQLPEEGKYYHLVTGCTGTYSQTEQRPNACFGIRTQTEGDYWGMQSYVADDPHQLWKFVASPENSSLYAMVNKADEYVPVIGIIKNQGGTVFQNTRFEIKSLTDGVIPAEAYGFVLNAVGTISETDITGYDTTIHGMKVGDTYVTIRPNQYDNNGSVQDNSSYYLNAAGNARQFAVNLWTLETPAPKKSEYWILVPEAAQVVPLPDPQPALGLEDAEYSYLINGYQGTYSQTEQRPNACFGVKADGGVNYYGMAPYVADDPHILWTFAPSPSNPELYAMVNKAGEYVPALNTIISTYSGTFNQDSRYLVKSAAGIQLPDDAYAFSVNEVGAITADNLTHYDATIHGMQVGDKYITIRPLQCDNRGTIQDNNSYYLNAAGNPRSFYINIWVMDADPAPATSQYWIVVPEAGGEVVAPALPEISCSIEIADGVVTIPANSYADVTITAEEGSLVAYAFVEDATATPQFNIMESNATTIRVDKAGVLHYYAVREGLESPRATLSFAVKSSSGITEVGSMSVTNEKVYDLQGRHVACPSKGIYIINGKKVIIK